MQDADDQYNTSLVTQLDLLIERLARIEHRITDNSSGSSSKPEQYLADRINFAMVIVRNYQESTKPVAVLNLDGITIHSRNPHPKEVSVVSAACDLLERFFDGKAT